LNAKGLEITDGEGPLSVGHPTQGEIAISIRGSYGTKNKVRLAKPSLLSMVVLDFAGQRVTIEAPSELIP
jgi:hypothetical protein